VKHPPINQTEFDKGKLLNRRNEYATLVFRGLQFDFVSFCSYQEKAKRKM